MKELLVLVVIAAVLEAVWEACKPAWPRTLVRLKKVKGVPVDRCGILVLAVAACFALRFDLLDALGVPFPAAWAGAFFTGILAGRISHLWHDLLGVVDGIRRDKKPIQSHHGL